VALRVVNRIEKEVLEAEYEHFLEDETQKCDRVGFLLDNIKDGQSKENEGWMKSYCGDCKVALDVAKDNGRRLI
jgi:hypothetical protein